MCTRVQVKVYRNSGEDISLGIGPYLGWNGPIVCHTDVITNGCARHSVMSDAIVQ